MPKAPKGAIKPFTFDGDDRYDIKIEDCLCKERMVAFDGNNITHVNIPNAPVYFLMRIQIFQDPDTYHSVLCNGEEFYLALHGPEFLNKGPIGVIDWRGVLYPKFDRGCHPSLVRSLRTLGPKAKRKVAQFIEKAAIELRGNNAFH